MSGRNTSIDFWRGFVLLTIFVNHIPGNVVEHLSYRNLSLSDSAEAFIFLSGLSVALVYYPKLPKGDILGVARRCVSRAAELYRMHLILTFAAVAMFAVAYVISDLTDLIEADGRATVFDDTARGITGILLLGHQLGYFNILPLYVILMLWAPVVLVLTRTHVALALGVALLLYTAVRLGGLSMPSWPEPGTWFFNPFAWQLMFTLGVAAGVLWAKHGVPHSRALLWAAWTVVIGSAVVVTNAFGLAPGLWDAVSPSIDIPKQVLGLGRLVQFLALAYLVANLRVASWFDNTLLSSELTRLGRHGLPVFAVGSLLAALGQVIMTLAAVKHSASPALIGMVFTIVGILGLLALVRYLEWTSNSSPKRGHVAAKTSAVIASSLPRRPSALHHSSEAKLH